MTRRYHAIVDHGLENVRRGGIEFVVVGGHGYTAPSEETASESVTSMAPPLTGAPMV